MVGRGWGTGTCRRYSIQLKISHREAIGDTMRCIHIPGFCWRPPDVQISHETASVGGFRGRPHLAIPASIGPWYIGAHSFLNSGVKPIVDGFSIDHCMSMCNCPSEKFICHAVDGCVCRHGYTGTSTIYLPIINTSLFISHF